MEDFPIKINLGGLAQKQDAEGAGLSINLKPFEKGLRSILAPRIAYQLSGLSWPFPQLFRLGTEVFVTTPDSILKVDGNWLTPMMLGIPNANYPWDAAVVGDFKVFVNNKVVVSGRDLLAIDISPKIPAGRSICEVGSQLVIASPWAYGAWNSSSVMWGGIGNADFTITRGNVAALRYANCGTVLKVLPQVHKSMTGLKVGFLAFGTAGVSSFLSDDLPAGYSMAKLSSVGIYSQLAAAGDEKDQFFVSRDKKLYSISDGVVKELGFYSQLKAAGSEIVLSYDHFNKELWVSY